MICSGWFDDDEWMQSSLSLGFFYGQYIYIYVIMKTMCPPGYQRNGFVATRAHDVRFDDDDDDIYIYIYVYIYGTVGEENS